MKLSLAKILSRKNLNLAVGLIALMVFLWLISYAIPSLFVQMFDTGLGNLILLGIVALASMANINLGVGLLIMFFILYRFAHMSGRREGAKNLFNAASSQTIENKIKFGGLTDVDIKNANKDQLNRIKAKLTTDISKLSPSEKTQHDNLKTLLDATNARLSTMP
jgi:hypothetical protein